MKYVGIQTQISRNNRRTFYLLLMFPVILLGMIYGFLLICDWLGLICYYHRNFSDAVDIPKVCVLCRENPIYGVFHWDLIWKSFLNTFPEAILITSVWFLIAYVANTSIIRKATHARPLERKENVRVYNIVENLCIAGGIEMPQINIIEDSFLNAFASGIDIKSYTITLTTGIIDKLTDEELSAVVGHELTHIKNRDTRLMVVSIVFVGIFSTVMAMLMRIISSTLSSSRGGRRKKNEGVVIVVLLVALLWSTIAYIFSSMTKLAISRKREYVADAGGAELCGNPLALSSALKKISAEPGLWNVRRNDLAQLYIIHPDEENDGFLKGIIAKLNVFFCTHPDTNERIRLLEQF